MIVLQVGSKDNARSKRAPGIRPVCDVVDHGADGAGRKPAPQDARGARGVGALDESLINYNGPWLPLQIAPVPSADVTPKPQGSSRSGNGTPGLQLARGSTARLRAVYADPIASRGESGSVESRR